MFEIIRSFMEVDDSMQIVECFLANVLSNNKSELKRHSKLSIMKDIALPIERHLKNDVDVVERLMVATGTQLAEQEHTVKSTLKLLRDAEGFKDEFFRV